MAQADGKTAGVDEAESLADLCRVHRNIGIDSSFGKKHRFRCKPLVEPKRSSIFAIEKLSQEIFALVRARVCAPARTYI